MRSRLQPIFLKGWIRIIEAFPGTELHTQPVPPPEFTPGDAAVVVGTPTAIR